MVFEEGGCSDEMLDVLGVLLWLFIMLDILSMFVEVIGM